MSVAAEVSEKRLCQALEALVPWEAQSDPFGEQIKRDESRMRGPELILNQASGLLNSVPSKNEGEVNTLRSTETPRARPEAAADGRDGLVARAAETFPAREGGTVDL